MAIKIFMLALCIVAVAADVAHLAKHAERSEAEHFDSHPIYNFHYDVQDEVSGDFKSQSESRDGDKVAGEYTVYDADGYQRLVKYTADAESGFRAEVHRHRLNAPSPKTAPTPVKLSLPPLPKVRPAKVQTVPASVRSFNVPTVVHHAPSHTVLAPIQTTHIVHGAGTRNFHSAPTVHLTPTAHFLHPGQSAVIAHHTSLSTPHVSLVYHS